MYTQNQYDIVDTEETIEFFKSQLNEPHDFIRREWISQSIISLEQKLKELYSQE